MTPLADYKWRHPPGGEFLVVTPEPILNLKKIVSTPEPIPPPSDATGLEAGNNSYLVENESVLFVNPEFG